MGSSPNDPESSFINYNKSSQIGLTDGLTKIIIKSSIYLLVTALFIECSLLPVSVLNFVLFLIMAIIIFKYFKYESAIELYSNLGGTLSTLKWISILFIFLKYIF